MRFVGVGLQIWYCKREFHDSASTSSFGQYSSAGHVEIDSDSLQKRSCTYAQWQNNARFATATMTRIPVGKPDSDDDKQWEDLPDEKWVPHSRSSTPSDSFKGTAAARTRRTRQRPIFPSTSPRKHNPGDYRIPIRARRERFFAELPPQDLGTAGPGNDLPIRQFPQEPIGTVPLQFCI